MKATTANDDRVLVMLAKNPNTPDDIMKQMVKSPIESVNIYAKAMLYDNLQL